jgi:hypothetical protein
MKAFMLTLILASTALIGQELVWNNSKTVGLIPAERWTESSTGDQLGFVLKAPQSSDPFKGRIDISTASTLNWTLDELWNEYVIKGFPLSLNGYEKIAVGKSTIDGEDSYWIECYSESQGIKFQGLSAVFVKNNMLHIVTCTSLPKYYDFVEADFKKMIESIRVKKTP